MQIIDIENYDEYIHNLNNVNLPYKKKHCNNPNEEYYLEIESNIENQAINWNRLRVLFFFVALLICDQLYEGNDKVPSVFGISK